MGITYFRRFRMEFDLAAGVPESPPLPFGYELVPYSDALVREHATAKFDSFRSELDADVFPCLSRQDGCLRLMREIVSRAAFVPEATWLLRHRDPASGLQSPVGTIQGLSVDGWGAVQNLGVVGDHRGKGLGSLLLLKAAAGFAVTGIRRMHLEVTTDNAAAVRLYEKLGFKKADVVYKAADIVGA
ncbi:GNAT family N-acetyltransferase [Crateriforma conspicua]|uniref:Putative acetyltransferase n=1 Tax=Crateriforma conspicua TaxID=2527996 RepID=A0A5C5Y003_9PLAN|nr:GNAT family N-acetyltransferase [Crateriforma conspicua]QDV62670.1 putative acetyltransferase [Crateriforma conspicua]TWT68560.1 putative acetyltransferase [Crateriforma conspicua]